MYEKIFKTSEGAKKAWASRRGASASPGKTASGKPRSFTAAEMTAYNTRHSKASGKGPKKIGTGMTMSGEIGTKYKVMPKSKMSSKFEAHDQFLGDIGVIQR